MRSILAAALLVPLAVPAAAQSLSATATVPSSASLEPITAIANPGQLSLGGSATTGPFPTLSAQTGGLVNAGQLSLGGAGGGGGRIGSSTGVGQLGAAASGTTGGAGVTGATSATLGTAGAIGATGTRNGFSAASGAVRGSISGSALSSISGTRGLVGGVALGTGQTANTVPSTTAAFGAATAGSGFGNGSGLATGTSTGALSGATPATGATLASGSTGVVSAATSTSGAVPSTVGPFTPFGAETALRSGGGATAVVPAGAGGIGTGGAAIAAAPQVLDPIRSANTTPSGGGAVGGAGIGGAAAIPAAGFRPRPASAAARSEPRERPEPGRTAAVHSVPAPRPGQEAEMNVVLGRVSLAVALVLGVSGAALARDAGSKAHGANTTTGLHGIGFAEPKFRSSLRTGRDQPYTWPVSDRYHPVSQPFYGRAY
ncbi:hypothetical protein [Methylobacterium sp. P5_C11]